MLNHNGVSVDSILDLLDERITALESITNALNASIGGTRTVTYPDYNDELIGLTELYKAVTARITALDQRLTELEVRPVAEWKPPHPDHKHTGNGPYCQDMLGDPYEDSYPCQLTEPHTTHYYSDDDVIIEWRKNDANR